MRRGPFCRPGKSGKEVTDEILKVRPDVKVFFTSGYIAEIIMNKGTVEEAVNFLSKPATPEALLVKIREVLG